MTSNRAFVRDIALAGAVLVCLVVAGAIRAARRPAPEEETPAVVTADPTNLDGESHQPLDVAGRPERKSARQVALDEIASHRERIAEDPGDEDVPAYQLAIANLHITKLGDYETASIELEELISHFPESTLVAQAYTKLARCYENMGWRGVADTTYKKMMRHFPEGSPNWEYARAKRRGATDIY